MVTLSRLCKEFKKIDINLIEDMAKTELKIDYITILELPEKNHNFKKNGLVMSTFQAFKDVNSINEQITWLKTLGILGVGFHKAHYKDVPNEVIQHSKELNMPLFSIPVNVPYHKILDIFNQLENEQLNLKSYEIYKMNEKILESVFLEKDSGYIINLIGNYIKKNIILLDSHMKVKSVWKEPLYRQSDLDYLTKEIISVHKETLLKSRFFKRETQLAIKNEDNKELSVNIIPVVTRKSFLGYLIINKTTMDNFYNDEVIRMGIRAISMSSYKQTSNNNHLRLKDIKKFETLINNDSNNLKESDFYIQISKLSYCLQVSFKNKETLEEAFNSINTVFMEKDSNVLTWIYNETLLAYLESEKEIEELIEILKMYSCQSIGLSSKFKETSINDINKMSRQARTAMFTSIDNGNLLSRWDQIGIEKLVFNIDELPLFKQLDEEILSRVIEYDRKKDGDLIKTLGSALSNFFNIKAISEEMFIHPNTVRYRLTQIKGLLDIDINQSSNYALVVLALRMYERNK